MGLKRALVLSTPQQAGQARELASELAGAAAGVFSQATMHTPIAVTEKALAGFAEAGADCVVSIGGGSTVGLGKAIASRNHAPHIAIPTTYAGSEVTPILGETDGGVKRTRRGPEIQPGLVIYDPELSDDLPARLSVMSGLNAMAHAAEGLYARDESPISRLMALEGLKAFKEALPAIAAGRGTADHRDRALYGAWMCGTVLGMVGMSIHHKLCHTLGGSLDAPHAETHSVLLPHTIAYVEVAAAERLAELADLFGPGAGAGLHDFAASVGAPLSLSEIGVREADLDRVADLAVADPYWCPRPIERQAIRELLQDAHDGKRPSARAR